MTEPRINYQRYNIGSLPDNEITADELTDQFIGNPLVIAAGFSVTPSPEDEVRLFNIDGVPAGQGILRTDGKMVFNLTQVGCDVSQTTGLAAVSEGWPGKTNLWESALLDVATSIRLNIPLEVPFVLAYDEDIESGETNIALNERLAAALKRIDVCLNPDDFPINGFGVSSLTLMRPIDKLPATPTTVKAMEETALLLEASGLKVSEKEEFPHPAASLDRKMEIEEKAVWVAEVVKQLAAIKSRNISQDWRLRFPENNVGSLSKLGLSMHLDTSLVYSGGFRARLVMGDGDRQALLTLAEAEFIIDKDGKVIICALQSFPKFKSEVDDYPPESNREDRLVLAAAKKHAANVVRNALGDRPGYQHSPHHPAPAIEELLLIGLQQVFNVDRVAILKAPETKWGRTDSLVLVQFVLKNLTAALNNFSPEIIDYFMDYFNIKNTYFDPTTHHIALSIYGEYERDPNSKKPIDTPLGKMTIPALFNHLINSQLLPGQKNMDVTLAEKVTQSVAYTKAFYPYSEAFQDLPIEEAETMRIFKGTDIAALLEGQLQLVPASTS